MSLLQTAPDIQVLRLLDLFPMTALKAHWQESKGLHKGELCESLAKKRDVKSINEFIEKHLGCCKQHVHIYSHDVPLKSIPLFPFQQKTQISNSTSKTIVRSVHVVRTTYTVLLTDPPEELKLDFLWPIELEWSAHHLILRLVTLEKNIKTYFPGRTSFVKARDLDESAILRILAQSSVGLKHTDIHKGIKTLWEQDFMDSPKTQFKKASSTTSEDMDEEKGIKKSSPEIYKSVKDALIFNALFLVTPRKDLFSVTAFSSRPSEGYVAFPRFTERPGDTDHVVREILRLN